MVFYRTKFKEIQYPFSSTFLKSDSTINFTSSSNFVFGSQPSLDLAFEGSPIRSSHRDRRLQLGDNSSNLLQLPESQLVMNKFELIYQLQSLNDCMKFIFIN